jgi:phage-related holin
MSKEKIVRKLTSRKLWMSIASFVSMLVIAMGKNQSEAAQISALIIAGATVIAYVVGEGLVDYSNIEDRDENIESRD